MVWYPEYLKKISPSMTKATRPPKRRTIGWDKTFLSLLSDTRSWNGLSTWLFCGKSFIRCLELKKWIELLGRQKGKSRGRARSWRHTDAFPDIWWLLLDEYRLAPLGQAKRMLDGGLPIGLCAQQRQIAATTTDFAALVWGVSCRAQGRLRLGARD